MLLDGIWTRVDGDAEKLFVGHDVAPKTTNGKYHELCSNSLDVNGRETEEKELVKSWDVQ